jgi:hypothetical protein
MLSGLISLAFIPSFVIAVNVKAFMTTNCIALSFGMCRDIRSMTCCRFPRQTPMGALSGSARSVGWENLQICHVAMWMVGIQGYQAGADPRYCNLVKDRAAGPQKQVCMSETDSAPDLGDTGAMWYVIIR